MKKLIFILFLFFSFNSFAQSNYYLIDTTGINIETLSEGDKSLLDSILPIANKAKHDTTLLRCLEFLAEHCWEENLWTRYNRLIIDVADKNLTQKGDSLYLSYKAHAINNVGYYFNSHGKSILALENYKAALNIFRKINELEGQSVPLNNLGYTYQNLGDLDKALDYYHQSLKIIEQIGDEERTSDIINNLAFLYAEQGDHLTSKIFLKRALEISLKFQNKRSIALAYSNLGNLLSKENKKDSAILYYQISYDLRKDMGNEKGMAVCLTKIGMEYESKNQPEFALEYYMRTLDIVEDRNFLKEKIEVKNKLGTLYLKAGKVKKALDICLSGYLNAQDLGYPIKIETTSLLLSEIYKELGEFEKSLEMYQLSDLMGDSIINDKNKKAVYRTQLNYEFEKKEDERILEEEKQKIITEKEKERKNTILWSISTVMILSIFFLLFLYNRFRLIKKQKVLIEDQKHELVSRNGELNLKNSMITDSILYAKKIQNAILPTEEQFKKHFSDAFVFFRPKDIVSGDFYWGYSVENTILFTAADCTGHGVPGAFMSLIGNNILDKIVGELNIRRPDLILERLSEELYRRLRSDNDSNIKDGMDLVICSVNLETLKLQMSGAYNPMYLVRNGELTQFKSDRYQLGNPLQIDNRKFTLNEFQLKKGDTIYLFTDGLPDQKGGEHSKKFYYPPFRDLLTEISQLPMDDQQKVLATTLDQWKGTGEQIDDILVLGIKF